MTVKWQTSRSEMKIVTKIIARFVGFCASEGIPLNYDVVDMAMDLDATNSNGCELDFAKLLAFKNFDFVHDVRGIQRHLNRKTGKLKDFFLPRCAR